MPIYITRFLFQIFQRALCLRKGSARIIRRPYRTVKGRTWILATCRRTHKLYRLQRFLRNLLSPRIIITIVMMLIVRPIRNDLFPVIRYTMSMIILRTSTQVMFIQVITIKRRRRVTSGNMGPIAGPSTIVIHFSNGMNFRLTLNIRLKARTMGLPHIYQLCRNLFRVIYVQTRSLSRRMLVSVKL